MFSLVCARVSLCVERGWVLVRRWVPHARELSVLNVTHTEGLQGTEFSGP